MFDVELIINSSIIAINVKRVLHIVKNEGGQTIEDVSRVFML